MLVVKQLRVKLHTKKRTFRVLHGLNWAGFVCSSRHEIRGQAFDFIKVGVPDRDVSRHTPKDSLGVSLDFGKASLPLGPGVAFAGLQSSH